MPFTYAILHEGDKGFGISFPDFPGCVSGGQTEEDAIRRGEETLNFHVAGMVEDGDQLPFVRTLSELRSDPLFADSLGDGFLTIVLFDLPGKSVRINVSMDENLLDAIDRAAQAKGQSRSAYLADAARARIRSAA
ncbi:putative RNase H-like HicB family nuclease [Phyllobacterium trifolii]|jgi:predicted RNase H-like HicB family nuclease|uniref:Putative RNase H-like HicB family nuclease n=1 Tax=Phyllobacterium trifolii TaxID=300193 RepID=A0A839UD15_9HYPH|nr:type II toxin-antitoxin system HicB family antitoxin [Phyllobacterium trifolii]MBB3147835.1 putative RNase H-like HicB family nuclease [Phyllobacterium trifolii]